MTTLKLILFTDIHLTTPGTTIAGRDPNANFERALGHALENHADAAAIVITGDLSDWGDPGDYRRLRARLASVPVPVHLAIGNHDDRPTFLDVFPEAADANGFVQQVVDLGGVTGLVLDTWAGPETHAGAFCAIRRAWLARELEAATTPVWLFMHHNPVPTHIRPLDRIMLRDAEAFAEIVATYKERLAHIVFGHCHLPLSGSLHGVPVSGARGTNHAGYPLFRETETLTGADLPEAYGVALTAGPAVTIHMVEFGAEASLRSGGSPDRTTWNRATMRR